MALISLYAQALFDLSYHRDDPICRLDTKPDMYSKDNTYCLILPIYDTPVKAIYNILAEKLEARKDINILYKSPRAFNYAHGVKNEAPHNVLYIFELKEK